MWTIFDNAGKGGGWGCQVPQTQAPGTAALSPRRNKTQKDPPPSLVLMTIIIMQHGNDTVATNACLFTCMPGISTATRVSHTVRKVLPDFTVFSM